MKYNTFNLNTTFQDCSSTASFEGFVETSAVSSTLETLHNSIPINSEFIKNAIYKGHDLDTPLEKMMEKFDPALQKLSQL